MSCRNGSRATGLFRWPGQTKASLAELFPPGVGSSALAGSRLAYFRVWIDGFRSGAALVPASGTRASPRRRRPLPRASPRRHRTRGWPERSRFLRGKQRAAPASGSILHFAAHARMVTLFSDYRDRRCKLPLWENADDAIGTGGSLRRFFQYLCASE